MSANLGSTRNPIHRTLGWTLLGLLLGAAQSFGNPAGIHVTGAGEVRVIPDLARLQLEVRREGTDAAALKAELDSVTREVLAFLRRSGVAEQDITAARISVNPRYRHENGDSTMVGLVASRPIDVTVVELDTLGTLINGALERGVNTIGNVALDASERPALERQALDLAIDDALAHARQIAARFGVRLGPLLDAGGSEPPMGPRFMEMRVAADSATAPAYAPGEMTIRREISATFAIDSD